MPGTDSDSSDTGWMVGQPWISRQLTPRNWRWADSIVQVQVRTTLENALSMNWMLVVRVLAVVKKAY